MGCDIHLVLEKCHGDKWIAVDTFTPFHRQYAAKDEAMDGWSAPIARCRNYERFAALAGVRGNGPAPLGVPEDASDTARFFIEKWNCDGHSHSWLPLDTAAGVWAATERNELSDFAKQYPDSHYFNVDCSEGSGNEMGDYRVIFWFDN